jgi:hypothetical protein
MQIYIVTSYANTHMTYIHCVSTYKIKAKAVYLATVARYRDRLVRMTNVGNHYCDVEGFSVFGYKQEDSTLPSPESLDKIIAKL